MQFLKERLVVLKNLSDVLNCSDGLEGLVTNLMNLLAETSPDYTISFLIAGILSNLTRNNENNIITALRSNGVSILLEIIRKNI